MQKAKWERSRDKEQRQGIRSIVNIRRLSEIAYVGTKCEDDVIVDVNIHQRLY